MSVPNCVCVSLIQEDGAITINYGRFSQLVLNFLVIVLILFMLIKAMQEIRNKISAQASTKQCPFCYMRILAPAIRLLFIIIIIIIIHQPFWLFNYNFPSGHFFFVSLPLFFFFFL